MCDTPVGHRENLQISLFPIVFWELDRKVRYFMLAFARSFLSAIHWTRTILEQFFGKLEVRH